VLQFLFLQVVRCERCYHRSYALRTIPVRDRVSADPKPAQSQSPGANSDSRVA